MGKFDGVFPARDRAVIDLTGVRVMGRPIVRLTGQKLNPRRERNLRFELEPIRA